MSNMSRWIIKQEEDNDIRCGGYRNDPGLEEDTPSERVSARLWEEDCVPHGYTTTGSLGRLTNGYRPQPELLRPA